MIDYPGIRSKLLEMRRDQIRLGRACEQAEKILAEEQIQTLKNKLLENEDRKQRISGYKRGLTHKTAASKNRHYVRGFNVARNRKPKLK